MLHGFQSLFKASREDIQPPTEPVSFLPYILILLPFAIGLALDPFLVLLTFVGAGLVAFKTQCLKPFLLIVSVAFFIAFLFPTPAAIYSDADYYVLPAIRFFANGVAVQPNCDGYYSMHHFLSCLPDGFFRIGAAFYRLFGWVDMGNVLLFLFLPVAWMVWRRHLGRCATAVLVCGPLTFASCLNPVPDGATYLLLLTALGAMRSRETYLALAALLVACTFKMSAWMPATVIAAVLLYQDPRRAPKIILTGIAAMLYNLPFFIHFFGGQALPTPDFAAMDDAARSLGWFARFAYAYLGHWILPGEYVFNVPMGGFDGGGIDGLGPFFRFMVWGSIALQVIFFKRLKSWWTVLLVGWVSVCCMPTLYVGYARYVPLFYVSVMLPFLLLAPRLTLVPAGLICAMPLAWLGWRCVLISERLTLLDPEVTVAVSSDLYNVRCALREAGFTPTEQTPQMRPSASLMYYTLPREGVDAFPHCLRDTTLNQRLTPATDKARAIAPFVLQQWFPWCMTHLHKLFIASLSYRVKCFVTFPRGKYDSPNIDPR